MTSATAHLPARIERAVPSCRVGVDLVAVPDVAASMEHFGERYLRRVFTCQELEDCSAGGHYSTASLAARFAAKEATIKVLEPTEVRPDWRAIEICRAPHGACTLTLRASAATLAAERGIASLSVSLTHEDDLAAAVVVAVVLATVEHDPAVGATGRPDAASVAAEASASFDLAAGTGTRLLGELAGASLSRRRATRPGSRRTNPPQLHDSARRAFARQDKER